jgi:hypothetical protein
MAAIRSLDVQAARAALAAEGGELLGTDDEVLRSLHRARTIALGMPAHLVAESRRWLRDNPQ